jgi:glycosyltransferase involved in cell wall biosynthesis
MNQEYKSRLASIVLATYNGEQYLRQQIDSILGQTCTDFELIAVDDASSDATLSILEEYAGRDRRVRVCPAQRNLGVVANFERGLRLAQGEFIALSDQDDIFRQDKLENLRESLQAHPACDLAVSDLSLIDETGRELAPSMWQYQKLKPQSGKPFRRLLYSNFATGCAMMFRRRLLEFALPFPPGCIVHDWWLAVVAASARGGGICLVNQPLTAYRQHGSNVIGAKAADRVDAKHVIARVRAAPRGEAAFEERIALFDRLHKDRLAGYLQCAFWSVEERRLIEHDRALILDYANDARRNLLARVTRLPARLHHALQTGGVASCLPAMMHTVFPYK